MTEPTESSMEARIAARIQAQQARDAAADEVVANRIRLYEERRAKQAELADKIRSDATQLAALFKARGVRPEIAIVPERTAPQPEQTRRFLGRTAARRTPDPVPFIPATKTHWIVTSYEETASDTPAYDPDRAAGTAPFMHTYTYRTYGVIMDAEGGLWRYHGPVRPDSLPALQSSNPRKVAAPPGVGLVITGPASDQILAPVEVHNTGVFGSSEIYSEDPGPDAYLGIDHLTMIGPTAAPMQTALEDLGARLMG